MNKKAIYFLGGFILAGVTYFGMASTSVVASAGIATEAKIGVVNFKECMDNSKIGKQEQNRFEEMKKQMELVLEEKEKQLNEMAPKFQSEYLDTIPPDEEAKLKETFKNLNQEVAQYQNQYYQMLSQANYQIINKLSELISTAANKVAKAKGLDLVLNTEACFYSSTKYDLSKEVIRDLDLHFVEEVKLEKKAEPAVVETKKK